VQEEQQEEQNMQQLEAQAMPEPHAPNAKPETLNQKGETLETYSRYEPHTPNAKPETLNPTGETLKSTLHTPNPCSGPDKIQHPNRTHTKS